MTEMVYVHGDRVYVPHRFGGCYDVIELGNTGGEIIEEVADPPEGAIRLVPDSPENLDRRLDIVMARQIESTGNVVSGLGEHGLANQLWALAARLRRRDRGLGVQSPS